jgi:hypothetical protein
MSEAGQPVLDVIENKLYKWNRKMFSIGGRVVVINLVLASLPQYFFSLFYKTPRNIIQAIVKIRRDFLCNGTDGWWKEGGLS